MDSDLDRIDMMATKLMDAVPRSEKWPNPHHVVAGDWPHTAVSALGTALSDLRGQCGDAGENVTLAVRELLECLQPLAAESDS